MRSAISLCWSHKSYCRFCALAYFVVTKILGRNSIFVGCYFILCKMLLKTNYYWKVLWENSKLSHLIFSPLSFWSGLFHLRIGVCPLLLIGMLVKSKTRMAKCGSRWYGSLWVVSSGSTLFAKESVSVSRVERQRLVEHIGRKKKTQI